MADRTKGARRRKAFADFKENQYNDSFSISESQKRKILLKNIFKYVFIIFITFTFIAVGFVLSDALLDISEQDYHDPNTYTARTTQPQSTTVIPTNPPETSEDNGEGESESETGTSEEIQNTSEQQ